MNKSQSPRQKRISYLLSKWNKKLNNAVIIGDYRLDLEAGRNAGISTILIGQATDEDTEKLADYQFSNLSKLKSSLVNQLLF